MFNALIIILLFFAAAAVAVFLFGLVFYVVCERKRKSFVEFWEDF